jgi:mitogen-activated protein kinase 1/3
MTILKKVTHPNLNKCVGIIKPPDMENFNDVYMVLDLCDMDMRKLLKSSKHLDECQVKSIVYDILCGLKYLHKA